jgi:Family of unknown function (DUF5335)
MDTAVEIPRAQWHSYFDRISHELDRAELSIEVLDGSWPPQLEASGLSLGFMAYDATRDLFEVAAKVEATPVPETLRHVVAEPLRVTADQPSATETRIEVDAGDGSATVIKLEREWLR